MLVSEEQNTRNAILDSISDGFFSIDEDLNITFMNRAAKEQFSRLGDNLVGRNLVDIFPTGIVFFDNYRKAIALKETVRFEGYSEALRAWLQVHAYPVESGLSIFFQDITERRQAEERFSKAFNLNPHPMVILDWPKGRCVDVNKAWQERLGYNKEEVLGKNSIELKLWTDDDGRDRFYKTMWEEGCVHDMEATYRTKSGEIITTLVYADFIEIHGEKYQMISVTDISRRRLLEQEIIRLDRLNLVGQMAAGLAHEIRNPLTVVKGYLQQFYRKMPQYHEQLALVLGELARVETITTDFLSLARNKYSVKAENDINRIILRLYPLIVSDGLESGVDVELDLADELPLLMLDEKEIHQLLLNLTRNGIQAMEGMDKLDGKRKLTIQTRVSESVVTWIVTNNGPVIPNELQQKIFDPFYTTKDAGTGLGLSICASIVERHQGIIEVFSEEEKGTSFVINFKV